MATFHRTGELFTNVILKSRKEANYLNGIQFLMNKQYTNFLCGDVEVLEYVTELGITLKFILKSLIQKKLTTKNTSSIGKTDSV